MLSGFLYLLPGLLTGGAFVIALGAVIGRKIAATFAEWDEADRASKIASLVRARERAERTGLQLAQEAERHAQGSVMRQHYTDHALEALARAHALDEAIEVAEAIG